MENWKAKDRRWAKYFFNIAEAVSQKSKDPNRKVGCIMVDPVHQRILATGYNGFPPGVGDATIRWERPEKYIRVVHAEANCIASAARFGISLNGAIAFVTLPPCPDCIKLMLATGISTIYAYDFVENVEPKEWHKHLAIGYEMCKESDVILRLIKKESLDT